MNRHDGAQFDRRERIQGDPCLDDPALIQIRGIVPGSRDACGGGQLRIPGGSRGTETARIEAGVKQIAIRTPLEFEILWRVFVGTREKLNHIAFIQSPVTTA